MSGKRRKTTAEVSREKARKKRISPDFVFGMYSGPQSKICSYCKGVIQPDELCLMAKVYLEHSLIKRDYVKMCWKCAFKKNLVIFYRNLENGFVIDEDVEELKLFSYERFREHSPLFTKYLVSFADEIT